MEHLIASLGYTAKTFASAEEYLESGCVAETSCLITDVQMPGMNGIALQSRLIADGCRVPIIFISANSAETLRDRALDAGAVAFLVKPFDGDRLVECLDKALGLSCA
jgi:FixJ family two-component response regulator